MDNWDVLVQGCNCMCTMGKGIAAQVKKLAPAAYAADQQTRKADMFKLGDYTSGPVEGHPDKLVVNAYTQFEYKQIGNEEGDMFQYPDFESFMKTKLNTSEFIGKRIAMPKIGAGLAGGDWDIILKIIEDNSKNLNITIYSL